MLNRVGEGLHGRGPFEHSAAFSAELAASVFGGAGVSMNAICDLEIALCQNLRYNYCAIRNVMGKTSLLPCGAHFREGADYH